MPVRIQLRRTKGWRLPAGAVIVSRPTKWGNPYPVGSADLNGMPMSPERAIERYRFALLENEMHDEIEAELRGKDLACWCKPGDACHADVLLEIANR